MKKSIKKGIYIIVPILIISSIFYSLFLWKCTMYTYYHIREEILYYWKIDSYIHTNKDCIVNWKSFTSHDSMLKIIPINNKIDSLKFVIINKKERDHYISFYFNGKYHIYLNSEKK